MSFYAPLLAVLYFGHVVEVFVIIFDWRIRFVCGDIRYLLKLEDNFKGFCSRQGTN